MYEQVFGFTSRPFSATPFVQAYFPAEAIHYALSQSRLCIERASGPVVVTGPSGTGKTLLLTMLSEQYQTDFSIVNIVCSNLVERKDLLQHILFELNLPYREMSEGELRLSLIDYLKSDDPSKMQSMGVLMLVDEAHTLSSELLDELRGITNFVRAGRPAISLVMAGSPSLEGNLIDTKSESFNQRIAARCFLSNLGQKETYEYVLTQVERAGGNAETLFTADALSRVYEASDGCPRLINQVCDYSLVLASSENSSRVTNTIVTEAWNDVQSIPSPNSTSTPKFESCAESGSHVADEILSTGDLVIEFGSLDDEPSGSTTISKVTQESKPVQSDPVNEPSFHSDIDDLADEYRLQDEAVESDRTNDLPVVTQYDYSIVSSSDDVVDEPVPSAVTPDFSDPFAESFEAEEAVDPSYVPFISAQNINSLMVTTEQLAMLETLVEDECEVDDSVEYKDDETVESPAEHSFAVIAKEDVEVDDETVASLQAGEDLTISADGLASLDQIQEDIRRLQLDLQFSKQNFASEAVHPDFAIVSAEQPIEELFQGGSVVVEPNAIDIAESTPVVAESRDMESALDPLQDRSNVSGAEDYGVAVDSVEVSLAETGMKYDDDDRDMMILSQPEKFQSQIEVEDESELGADVRISTGKACRVDYHELFRQLRSAN